MATGFADARSVECRVSMVEVYARGASFIVVLDAYPLVCHRGRAGRI
jgi:hypothetical protein